MFHCRVCGSRLIPVETWDGPDCCGRSIRLEAICPRCTLPNISKLTQEQRSTVRRSMRSNHLVIVAGIGGKWLK